MTVYQYHMDYMTGYDLGEELFEVTSLKYEWNHGDVHRFFMEKRPVFDIVVKTSRRQHQVRNGWIKFWIGRGVAATYSYLQQFLRSGFADIYHAIEESDLKSYLANPNDPYFQLFVLFRFEIARRKKYDDRRIPTWWMTKIAVNTALHLDDEGAYETLINMFSQPLDLRRSYYEQLQQRQFMWRVKHEDLMSYRASSLHSGRKQESTGYFLKKEIDFM